MPGYVNIGAWVGPRTMVDTWATVGSCAQIGADVHLAGGVGIGGVLEPPNARPGDRRGRRLPRLALHRHRGRAHRRRRRAVAPNVSLTASVPIIDVTGSEPVEHRGAVPPRAVVVPGTRPKEFPAGTYELACALIIGWRQESHDEKLSLNDVAARVRARRSRTLEQPYAARRRSPRPGRRASARFSSSSSTRARRPASARSPGSRTSRSRSRPPRRRPRSSRRRSSPPRRAPRRARSPRAGRRRGRAGRSSAPGSARASRSAGRAGAGRPARRSRRTTACGLPTETGGQLDPLAAELDRLRLAAPRPSRRPSRRCRRRERSPGTRGRRPRSSRATAAARSREPGAAIRLPLPENSATRAVGVPDHDLGRAPVGRDDLEHAVGADAVADVAEPARELGLERPPSSPARRAGSCCRARATSRIASAVSSAGRSASTMTMPGMRRIHLRW